MSNVNWEAALRALDELALRQHKHCLCRTRTKTYDAIGHGFTYRVCCGCKHEEVRSRW